MKIRVHGARPNYDGCVARHSVRYAWREYDRACGWLDSALASGDYWWRCDAENRHERAAQALSQQIGRRVAKHLACWAMYAGNPAYRQMRYAWGSPRRVWRWTPIYGAHPVIRRPRL